MKFNSATEMLDYIKEGNDLYNPVLETYVFLYNDCGSIAIYSITVEHANILSKKAADIDGFWGGCLGPGGYIYDDPSYEDYTEEQTSNLECCEEFYMDENWVNTNDWGEGMTKLEWLQRTNAWSIIQDLDDKAYDFYYMAMHDNGMDLYDADDYAWICTLINYDIGADRAKEILKWLYENDQTAMSFTAESIPTLKNICEELDLKIDFSKALTETPDAIHYVW